jgi:hypothetical protein
MRDLYSNLKTTQVLAPAVYDADQNSDPVDLQGFGSCLLLVNVGAAGVTLSETDKIELEVEETDDKVSGPWTDVDPADLAKSVTGTNDGCFAVLDNSGDDSAVYATAYRGHKRYCRVVVNFIGTHGTGTPIGVTALLGHAHVAPVTE